MNKETILGLLRHILTFGGGAAVTKGLADEADATAIIGALISLVGAIWSVIEKRKRASAGIVPTIIALGALSFLLLSSPGCGTLDKSGVYRGDQLLYQSELTTVTSYGLLKTYLEWERDNEAALARWPAIHQSAKHIEANWQQWFKTAYALHDAYKLDPSQENAAALNTALKVIRAALTESTKYMNQANSGN